MVKERRSRSKSPPRRTAEVTTKGGKKYEVKEQPRAKGKKQVEAAERRRDKDTVVQAVASTLQKQPAGRPKKGEEGPRKGSLRYVTEATGGLVGRGQLQRGAAQLAEHGKVRDQRKHNRSEANLTDGQKDAILGYMYDDFEQKKHVHYEKVKGFAVLVQHDASICRALGVEPCAGLLLGAKRRVDRRVPHKSR